jgi:hypothetical protein
MKRLVRSDELEEIYDKIKIEIMMELGIPNDIINSGLFVHLPSRMCGYIGDKVKERYRKYIKSIIIKETQKERV